MASKKVTKKYRNTITFTDRNNTRIRIRQKNISFSQAVNEDLAAYYDLLDCMAIEMNHFFTYPKWRYYCDALREAEIYRRKHTLSYTLDVLGGLFKPWSRAREIARVLEDGPRKGLDVLWGVDAKALAQEARGLDIAQATWVYDRVRKGIGWWDMSERD